ELTIVAGAAIEVVVTLAGMNGVVAPIAQQNVVAPGRASDRVIPVEQGYQCDMRSEQVDIIEEALKSSAEPAETIGVVRGWRLIVDGEAVEIAGRRIAREGQKGAAAPMYFHVARGRRELR